MLNNTTHYMWKEVALFFVAILVVRGILIAISLRIQNKYMEHFYTGAWEGLIHKCRKLRKFISILAGGPLNPWTKVVYNNLSCVIASVAYMEQDIKTFLNELHATKPLDRCPTQYALLSLYYATLCMQKEAREYCTRYLNSTEKDATLALLLEEIFSNAEIPEKKRRLFTIIQHIRNPALVQLIRTYLDASP